MNRQTRAHIHVERDEMNIAWLWLDVADAGANTLSTAVIREFEQVLDSLDDDRPEGLVIASRKPGFIAGANVSELAQLDSVDDAVALVERGQQLMDRIAALGMPTVARIRGYCMGGGLELALACRYRLADDDPATRLALPEVKLGIHPGFGGSARLPALIGPAAALDLMLSGRSIDGRAAKRMGLVDHCLSPWQLDEGARRLVLDDPGAHRPDWRKKLLDRAPLRNILHAWSARQLRGRVRREHYPAPWALLELWKEHGKAPLPSRLRVEKESLARLIEGDAARNLIRVFLLQDRLKSEARSPDVPVANHVHVIGAGTMGGDIAAWLAVQGKTVTLVDERPEALASALKRAKALAERRLKRKPAITAAMDRLIPDPQSRGAAKADLIIEAIVEDLDAKRGLYAELEAVMRKDAVLTTNTSSLPIEQLAERLKRPERLVGIHFFNPVAKMPLVEIVAGRNSDSASLDRGQALIAAIDKLPLRVASGPGFLVNRLLMPYMLEAARMYAEGKRREDIDAAARRFGMPMGPLELADTVGIDICVSAADVMAETQGLEVPERMRQFVAAGRLGRKTGRGFYTYRKGKPQRERGTAEDTVLDRMGIDLIMPLIEEAARCRDDGVVADGDLVDAGAIFGTGFAPFTGGPLHLQKTKPQALRHEASREEKDTAE